MTYTNRRRWPSVKCVSFELLLSLISGLQLSVFWQRTSLTALMTTPADDATHSWCNSLSAFLSMAGSRGGRNLSRDCFVSANAFLDEARHLLYFSLRVDRCRMRNGRAMRIAVSVWWVEHSPGRKPESGNISENSEVKIADLLKTSWHSLSHCYPPCKGQKVGVLFPLFCIQFFPEPYAVDHK